MTSLSSSTALTCSWLSKVLTASLSKVTLFGLASACWAGRVCRPVGYSVVDSRESLNQSVFMDDLAALVDGMLLCAAGHVRALFPRIHTSRPEGHGDSYAATSSSVALSLQVTCDVLVSYSIDLSPASGTYNVGRHLEADCGVELSGRMKCCLWRTIEPGTW